MGGVLVYFVGEGGGSPFTGKLKVASREGEAGRLEGG